MQAIRVETEPIHARDVLQDGLFAGLIGGLGMIAIYFLYDVATASPLRTPTVLGTLLFQGVEAARSARPELAVAIAYNGIHVLAWLAAGMLCAYLVQLVEHHPRSWYLVFVGAAFVALAAFLLDAAVNVTGLPRLHLWVGGFVGVSAMGAFLVWRHPAVLRRAGVIWKD